MIDQEDTKCGQNEGRQMNHGECGGVPFLEYGRTSTIIKHLRSSPSGCPMLSQYIRPSVNTLAHCLRKSDGIKYALAKSTFMTFGKVAYCVIFGVFRIVFKGVTRASKGMLIFKYKIELVESSKKVFTPCESDV